MADRLRLNVSPDFTANDAVDGLHGNAKLLCERRQSNRRIETANLLHLIWRQLVVEIPNTKQIGSIFCSVFSVGFCRVPPQMAPIQARAIPARVAAFQPLIGGRSILQRANVPLRSSRFSVKLNTSVSILVLTIRPDEAFIGVEFDDSVNELQTRAVTRNHFASRPLPVPEFSLVVHRAVAATEVLLVTPFNRAYTMIRHWGSRQSNCDRRRSSASNAPSAANLPTSARAFQPSSAIAGGLCRGGT